MDKNFLIVLSLSMLTVGFTGGFYVANALQKQIEVLIGAAIILAFLTWLGTGANFIGLIRDWYKDKKEAERIPTLEVGEVYKAEDNTYYLNFKKTKVEGTVEKCAGFLTVKEANIINFPDFF